MAGSLHWPQHTRQASDALVRDMLKLAGFFCPLIGVRMTHYRKPPLSIQAQLELLQQRGLVIGDAANAKRYLQRVGY